MRVAGGWKLGAGLVAVMMVFAIGCAKKQTVKSTEAPSEAPAASTGAKAAAPSEGIVAETVKPPEAPIAERPKEEGTLTAKAAAEAATAAATTEEKQSPFQDIRFDFDKSFIRDDAKPVLAGMADYMKKNPSAKLSIEGHCDERGTAEYNMALGERRAESARTYLSSLGVDRKALSTVSFGKEKPLDPAHTEDAWAKNRRDHFVLK